MKRLLKNRFVYRYVLPFAGYIVIKLILFTYRVILVDHGGEKRVFNKGKLPLYAILHQRLLASIIFFGKRKPVCGIISRSKDGDLAAALAYFFGVIPVRGSSSIGGLRAILEIKKLKNRGYSVGHVVDGPTGPYGVVKPGLIYMAKQFDMPVIPVMIFADRKWFINSWDKFMIPKPFAKITILLGCEIDVDHDIDEKGFERKRLEVENIFKYYYANEDKFQKNI